MVIVLQGCDKRVISPNVRHGAAAETFKMNVKLAIKSELDSSVRAPTDSDLNYAAERLSEEEKLQIVTDAYRQAMEHPSFWEKTHPKDSMKDSEWEAYMQSTDEAKQKRAQQAAQNYLDLMRQ
jgi:hypothetical protein